MEEHLLEKDVQRILAGELQKIRTPDGRLIRAYSYGKEGFMQVGHKKRFDFLFFIRTIRYLLPLRLSLNQLTGVQ